MTEEKRIHKASDIASALVALSDPEKGDIISNLKLQKLLYYAQGFHLALYRSPLFNEEILAWQYGPVVPEVYHEYKDNGSYAIFPQDGFDLSFLDPDQIQLLIDIYEIFGQYSAIKLMNMTHDELPWKSTSIGGVISKRKLANYFAKVVKSEENDE